VDATLFFFGATLVLSVTSLALLIAWLSARGRAQRAEDRLAGAVPAQRQPRAVAEEQVMNELADLRIEMERIAEGQRFVAKVLADRPPNLDAVPKLRSGQVNTPH